MSATKPEMQGMPAYEQHYKHASTNKAINTASACLPEVLVLLEK